MLLPPDRAVLRVWHYVLKNPYMPEASSGMFLPITTRGAIPLMTMPLTANKGKEYP